MRPLRDQHGFTLVEVLVAMVAGLVVISALFTILEVSLHQTSRIDDRVEAAQVGDIALTRVIDPLRSACIAREATPVQTGSGPTKLIFITGYSQKTIPEASEVFKDTFEWKAVGSTGAGRLTALMQKATGGSWPTFTTWEASKSVLIAENIYEHTLEEGGKTSKYLFRYFKYGTAATSGTEAGLGTLTPLAPSETTGLTAAEAETAAGVEVNFAAAPSDNYLALHRAAEFSDQVTFAFAAPGSEATITDAPCQ